MKRLFSILVFAGCIAGSSFSADTIMTFSVIRQCFPNATNIGIMMDERRMDTKDAISASASTNGMTPIILPLKSAQNIGPGLNKFVNDFNVEIVYMPESRFASSARTQSFLSKKCGVKKVALVSDERGFVEKGALMCIEDQGGTPVLVVNAKTASVIGFTPPSNIKVEMVGK